MKDGIQESVQDSDNLLWFCDGCLHRVKETLSSPGRLSSNRKKDRESPDETVTDTIPEKIVKRFYEIQSVNITYMDTIVDQNNEITILRESNIELIHLLSNLPGGLAGDTMPEDIYMHIQNIHQDVDMSKDLFVFDLKSKRRKKSFKVGSSCSTQQNSMSSACSEGNYSSALSIQNVRGLRTKMVHFSIAANMAKYDISIFTETWLTEEYTNAELGLNE
ncbi:hypothetical protein HHI36_009001 [Cryptolaemus montrouzieri]|uniref:Uncharacterized protein n=1 Tax=Cryptolaemus montrouzieri TaxID=559131 RepID=A0ABD2MUW7_9CUCU